MSNPKENVITSKNDTREQVNFDLSSLPANPKTNEEVGSSAFPPEAPSKKQEDAVTKTAAVSVENIFDTATANVSASDTESDIKQQQQRMDLQREVAMGDSNVRGVKSVFDADKAMILILLNRLQGRKTESDELRTKIEEMRKLKDLLEGLKKDLNDTDGALSNLFKDDNNSNFKVDSGDNFQLNDENLNNYPIYLNNLIEKYKELIKFILENQDEKTVQIAEISQTLANVNAELQEKNAALVEKTAELGEKDAALAEKDAALAEKGAALAEKGAALAEKDIENQFSREREAGLAEKADKLQQVKSDLELQYQDSLKMIKDLESQLKSLENIADGSVAKEDMEKEINKVQSGLEETIDELENGLIVLKGKLDKCEESKRKISENLDRLNKEHLKFVLGEIRKNKCFFT